MWIISELTVILFVFHNGLIHVPSFYFRQKVLKCRIADVYKSTIDSTVHWTAFPQKAPQKTLRNSLKNNLCFCGWHTPVYIHKESCMYSTCTSFFSYTGHVHQENFQYAETYGNKTARLLSEYRTGKLQDSTLGVKGRGGDAQIPFPTYYDHDPSRVIGTRPRTWERWQPQHRYDLLNSSSREKEIRDFNKVSYILWRVCLLACTCLTCILKKIEPPPHHRQSAQSSRILCMYPWLASLSNLFFFGRGVEARAEMRIPEMRQFNCDLVPWETRFVMFS